MKKQGNIYLIGFMGVGKTTVSKYLRELTGWEEVDTDKVIVRKKNMGIPEIFEKYGENYFRNLESHILEDYAKKGQRIVSCGGGIILRENNRRLMKKSGTVILLSATPQTIYENVKDGKVFEAGEIKIWKCRNCGHIVVGTKAPEICPICAHPKAYFEIKAENY